MSPSNPSSRRRRSRMGREKVAAHPDGSSAGYATWAVMTVLTPAATAAPVRAGPAHEPAREEERPSGRPADPLGELRAPVGGAAEEDDPAGPEAERRVDRGALVAKAGVLAPAERREDQAAGGKRRAHAGVIAPNTRAPRAPVAAGRLPGCPWTVR